MIPSKLAAFPESEANFLTSVKLAHPDIAVARNRQARERVHERSLLVLLAPLLI
ncbi:MAG TPA: hypothetical protein VHB01_10480 [Nitrosospira sp.]|nr:hypothetical protein [Nitrosospira sp.]